MSVFGWLHNKLVGQNGEKIAARYLEKHKLKIVAKNWRVPNVELDIVAICKKKKELHIVEVKSRTSDSWEAVGHSLTNKKVNALRRGAIAFKRSHRDFADYTIIFDVVVVFFNDKKESSVELVSDIRF